MCASSLQIFIRFAASKKKIMTLNGLCYYMYTYVQGYFDTLRLEVADKGIEIQSICPGPVDTPFLRGVFREQLNSEVRVSVLVERRE